MKYIKMFNESTNISEIDAICEKYNITNYTINDDDSIDVNGYVNIYDKKLKVLPLKFRNVSGNFICSSNQLTNLIGSPQNVGGGFYCSGNRLTNLIGAPQNVGVGFYCIDNQLTNLIGAPQYVGGGFDCSNNNLTTLEGVHKKIGGDFICYNNKLTNLIGAPQYVGRDFYCHSNQLTSLEGAPKKVYGDFWCGNNKIKNIDYLPKKYTSLKIDINPISKILDLFTKYDEYGWISNTTYKELICEFIDREIIQYDILLVNRLVEFLDDIDKPKSREELIELLKIDYEIR